MTTTSNAALARRWFEEVWNQKKDATVTELFGAQSIGHMEGAEAHGPSQFLTMRASLLGAFPDLSVTVEDVVAEGEQAVVRWSARGTHKGAVAGIPASGRGAAFRGMTWMKFANGRIVEGWDSWNQGRLLEELRTAAGGSADALARHPEERSDEGSQT